MIDAAGEVTSIESGFHDTHDVTDTSRNHRNAPSRQSTSPPPPPPQELIRKSPQLWTGASVHDYNLDDDRSMTGINVIEYDHKQKLSIYEEPETLTPLKMFDYDHGSKRTRYLQNKDFDAGFRITSRDFDDLKSDSKGSKDRQKNRDRRDGPRGRDRDGPRERDRDGPKDRDRDGPRDRERDSGRDREHDGQRNRERDGLRDREGPRDRDRDGPKDTERDGPKDRERDTPRERDRDGPRDRDRTTRRRSRSRERGSRDVGVERDDRRRQHNDNKEDNKENERNKSFPAESSSSNSVVERKNRNTTGPKARAVLVEDILSDPGRTIRPPKILIILRGPPGSGKTYVAKLIKDKEVEMKGSAPRIISLDDYFMVETDKTETDPETGRKVTKKVMEYEYESGMETHYRASLIKAFKKTVSDGFFSFIIIDCVNNKIEHYEEMYSFAVQNGFQVYITEMDMDASVCSKRNIHKRTEKEIQDIIDKWERTPNYQVELDIRSLLQSAAITEVDMEDCSEMIEEDATTAAEADAGKEKEENKKEIKGNADSDGEGGEDVASQGLFSSKWDNMEFTGEKLDKLDGLVKARRADNSIKDWLQLPDDYYDFSARSSSKPGTKRVRWADLEERQQQEKLRAIGFVVGQTDWSRMMDPSLGGNKLTQTKYI